MGGIQNMKKKIVYPLVLLLLAVLVVASYRETWTNTYTDELGLKTLAGQECDSGGADVDWSIVTWSDDSSNTSDCIDYVRCRASSDGSNFGSYTTTGASGTDLGLSGQYLECQLNLTNTTANACNISGFGVVCGGYNADFGASDTGTIFIDMLGTIFVALVGLAGIIGLVMVFNFIKGKKQRF